MNTTRGLRHRTVALAMLTACTLTACLLAAAGTAAASAGTAGQGSRARGTSSPTAVWPKFSTPRRVYVANASGLPGEDLLTLVTLQGVYNGEQHPSRLYLVYAGEDQLWLTQVPPSIRQVTLTPPSGETLLQLLLAKFRPFIKGAIVADPSNSDTVNLATTMAGLDQAVVIEPDQESLMASLGIPVLYSFDTATFTADDPVQTYEWGITNLLPQTSAKLLVMLPGTNNGDIRDYSVATHAFIFWLTSTEPTEEPLLNTILAHTPANTPVMGYVPDENPDVADLSEQGHFLSASDLLTNGSFWASIPSPPRLRQKTQPAPLAAKPNTAYVAFLSSDGDNAQYMEHTMVAMWNEGDLGAVPMGWTVAAGTVYFDPAMLEYFYRNLPADSELDAGSSGIGYTSRETGTDLTQFAQLSGEIMAKDGLHTADSYQLPDTQSQYAQDAQPPLTGISQNEPLLPQQIGKTLLYGQTSEYLSTPQTLFCAVRQQAQTTQASQPLFLEPLVDGFTLSPQQVLQVAQSLALAAQADGINLVFTTPTELELTMERYYAGQETGLPAANVQSRTGAQVLAEPSAGTPLPFGTVQVNGPNLVTNPSGASGTTGWGTSGGSISATTYDGAPALHYTSSVSTGESWALYRPDVTDGDTYTFTADVAGSGQVFLDVYTGTEDQTSLPVQLTSSYQQLTWTVTIPATATAAHPPSLTVREDGAGPVSVYISNASVAASTAAC